MIYKKKKTEITKIYSIIAYEIMSITITPNLSANLELMSFCNNNQLYNKRYFLIGKEYTDWSTSNYLDFFISNN